MIQFSILRLTFYLIILKTVILVVVVDIVVVAVFGFHIGRLLIS